jgi:hypothetical protein
VKLRRTQNQHFSNPYIPTIELRVLRGSFMRLARPRFTIDDESVEVAFRTYIFRIRAKRSSRLEINCKEPWPICVFGKAAQVTLGNVVLVLRR